MSRQQVLLHWAYSEIRNGTSLSTQANYWSSSLWRWLRSSLFLWSSTAWIIAVYFYRYFLIPLTHSWQVDFPKSSSGAVPFCWAVPRPQRRGFSGCAAGWMGSLGSIPAFLLTTGSHLFQLQVSVSWEPEL